jgi:transcriptional regulator with PAS, ATPase and Fis domain
LSVEPVFESAVMQQLLRMIDRVAKHSAAVLLIGETGVGKEVLAQTIHARSPRAKKAIIEINCGALPDHLVESELFGYEKGAFSGADQTKQGLFELANGGTLFLDEIGELDIRLQTKLLRVLDGHPYFRVGGSRKIDVNVRVVAATNRDLKDAVSKGTFRADLFHRIAQFQINVPALRERKEDIRVLADLFLQMHRPAATFTPAAMDALLSYEWPGNVRELKNTILRAATMSDSERIDVVDLDLITPRVMAAAAAAAPSPPSSRPVVSTVAGGSPVKHEPVTRLDDMERSAIMSALQDSDGHQGRAAEQLGISRRTLTRKLKQYRGGLPARAIGVLSKEQQDYFRADLDVECTLTSATASITGRLRNVSATGVAVRDLRLSSRLDETVALEFMLPDGNAVTGQARVAWTQDSEAGLRFVGSTPSSLASWLAAQQESEGWTPLADHVAHA